MHASQSAIWPTFDLPLAVSQALTGELTPEQAADAASSVSRGVQHILAALSCSLNDRDSVLDKPSVISIIEISASMLETAEIIKNIASEE